MVAKRWKMDEDHGEEYVMLPFLADEELISISGWKRIAAAFSCVAESTNAEKRDRIGKRPRTDEDDIVEKEGGRGVS